MKSCDHRSQLKSYCGWVGGGVEGKNRDKSQRFAGTCQKIQLSYNKSGLNSSTSNEVINRLFTPSIDASQVNVEDGKVGEER